VHFRFDENVLVICDMLLYYEEGNPKKFMVPNVMVCFGVKKEAKRTYKLWVEGSAPRVVIEVSSEKTWRKDIDEKLKLYEKFGVEEYYVFDPERLYLKPNPFRAYRLINGKLIEAEIINGRIYSEALGLELVDTGLMLRLCDPMTGEFLLTHQETEEARWQAEQLRLQAEEALREETRAKQKEIETRMAFEKELERLRAELAQLKQ
jgi:hypothetical protein